MFGQKLTRTEQLKQNNLVNLLQFKVCNLKTLLENYLNMLWITLLYLFIVLR